MSSFFLVNIEPGFRFVDVMKTGNSMRLITFFKMKNIISCEHDGKGSHRIIQVVEFGRANDRSGDTFFRKHPGQGNLRIGQFLSFSNLIHPSRNCQIVCLRVKIFTERIGFGSVGRILPAAGLRASNRGPMGTKDDGNLLIQT